MTRTPLLHFEEPHGGLQNSYRALIREFQDAGEPLVPFPLAFPNDDFPAFLARLAACARGEGLPAGFVPHSTYWLVSDGVVVGVANLRHALTEALRREGGNIGYGVRPSARRRGFARELLRRTLERARDRGLPEAWLTCAKSNVASARTILGNGGILISEEFLPERGEIVQRYRIALSSGHPPAGAPMRSRDEDLRSDTSSDRDQAGTRRRLLRALVASAATGGAIYLLVMRVALPALRARLTPGQIESLRQAFDQHPAAVLGGIVGVAALLALPVLGVFRWTYGPLKLVVSRKCRTNWRM